MSTKNIKHTISLHNARFIYLKKNQLNILLNKISFTLYPVQQSMQREPRLRHSVLHFPLNSFFYQSEEMKIKI